MIHYPPELPISEKRQEIADALRDHQVIVVAGETGSGKTTQLPKICLDMGLAEHGLIGHTQPRRLAARSVAARIAEELQQPLGEQVGYQVRFTDQTNKNTAIKLMTDGILLAEIQQDRLLKKYQVLIIDEAHERSLNIDFLLGYLKRLIRKRPDLKVIITSATIDVEKFSKHFDDAPVISVSGRTYPVEILYQDPQELPPDDSDEEPLAAGVMHALRRIAAIERERRYPPGDVLVFLSGERDIRDLALYLRKQQLLQTEILPLYARLSQAEQQRIFAPHAGRRIILSTNVAETSLTVPGIRYVIDSGLARISRYSVQSKVQRLPVEPVSQASANQRAGRCGRIASGICIRLYSEQDFLSRPEFTDPEILRTNLSAVILQMLLLKLGDIERFPFVEVPERKSVNDGFKLLTELGAITGERRLTDMGRAMARLPADPRLARMLLEAAKRCCLYEMLIIVSVLCIQDPRDTPADKRQAARERHQQYVHPRSDFLSWVTLWESVEEQRQNLTKGQFRKYCKQNFLSWLRLREWRETHRQLMLACQSLGFKAMVPGSEAERDYEATHRAILPGSLNQLGQRNTEGLYVGSRGRRFSLFPSSVLYRATPRWIVTAELIETSRLFAATAAKIEPEWVVDAATHLIKREYFDAHWSRKRGEVMAYEKISLYGLVLIEKRRVSYSSIDPQACRDLFIREGLVAEQLNSRAEFYRHNRALLADIRRQEEKERRPDILVAEDQLVAFYEERLPSGIIKQRTLERWCRQQDTKLLHMQRDQVIARPIEADSSYAFPDHTHVQNNRLRLDYRFAPGKKEDGIALTVPSPLLAQLTQEDLDWAVPGMVHDRCVALVRALPKSLRKRLVPVPDFVSQALQDVESEDKPLLTQLLAARAWQLRQVRIGPGDWDEPSVPEYLRPRVNVVDEQGKQIASGQNLLALQQRYEKQHKEQASKGEAAGPVKQSHPLECEGLSDWSFGELPEQVEIRQGLKLQRYPALRDCGDSVSIVLYEKASRAAIVNQYGLARLLILRTPQQKNLILKQLKKVRVSLGLKLLAQPEDWQDNALVSVYRLNFQLSGQRPHNRQDFDTLLASSRADLVTCGERLCRLLEQVYDKLFDIRRRLAALPADCKEAKNDMDRQLSQLFPNDFPASVPDSWIWDISRYIKAIDTRLDKLPAQIQRDAVGMREIQALEQEWSSGKASVADTEPDFFWWLQELRVSLFAQQLGTRGPVSVKRLRKRLMPGR